MSCVANSCCKTHLALLKLARLIRPNYKQIHTSSCIAGVRLHKAAVGNFLPTAPYNAGAVAIPSDKI
jgi:hypothetical protein